LPRSSAWIPLEDLQPMNHPRTLERAAERIANQLSITISAKATQ
jgi:hypothetical protein